MTLEAETLAERVQSGMTSMLTANEPHIKFSFTVLDRLRLRYQLVREVRERATKEARPGPLRPYTFQLATGYDTVI